MEENDVQLIHRILSGDEAAFTVRHFSPNNRACLFNLCKSCTYTKSGPVGSV